MKRPSIRPTYPIGVGRFFFEQKLGLAGLICMKLAHRKALEKMT